MSVQGIAESMLEADPWLKLILTTAAVLGLIFTVWRWARPRYDNAKSDARAIRDTLVGREALFDSITGREISPAVPGIGSRMSDQETDVRGIRQDVGLLTRAVADLASAQADMTTVQSRLDDHDHRLAALEQGHQIERIASKAESIQAWRAMEAIAKDDDPLGGV